MTARLPSERSFGLSVGPVAIAFAILGWWRGHMLTAEVLAPIGLLLTACGAAAPALLRVPNRIWWRLAHALGWINARILLTLFFATVLTPAGVVMRALGRNPLRAQSDGTTWTPYSVRRRDPKHYEHLF